MKLLSFFFPKIIYKINSPVNGEIKVVEQFGKRSIKVSGIEQSGPMVERIWEKGVKKFQISNCFAKAKFPPESKFQISNVLILGLGGGSVVKVINKHYPQAKILAIEIDPIMIKLGREYLNLSKYQNLEIKIDDAFQLVKSLRAKQFDLILVDLYLGKEVPEKIGDDRFLKNVKRILSKKGIVIFNRLRGRKRQNDLDLFFEQLKKIFKSVKVVKPLVNQLFICS